MPTVQEALDSIWRDESLKGRLLADPKPVLEGFGMEFSPGVSVQVHENTPSLINAVLPAKPATSVTLGAADPVSRIVEQAWQDAAFKAKLLSDPREAAAECGLRLPESVELKVWENSATVEHLVLPLNPAESELSDADLEAVAGGSSGKGAQPGAVLSPSSNTTAAPCTAPPPASVVSGTLSGIQAPSSQTGSPKG